MSKLTASNLQLLAGKLADLYFGYPTQFAATLQLRDTVVRRLRENLAARQEDVDAPLVAVLAGSTGVGKSTLMNSLMGKQSFTSARRPTTLTPVLVYHPDDELWVAGDRILGGFEKIRLLADSPVEFESEIDPGESRPRLIMRASEQLCPGLVLVDCPDLDSYLESNREVATHLLEVADLWLLVTSSERYREASGLDLLTKAAQRQAMVGVVLNRVTQGTLLDSKSAISTQLQQAGLEETPIFTILESPLHDGELPHADVESLRCWLESVAGDVLLRTAAARQIFFGSIAEIWPQIEQITADFSTQSQLHEKYRQALSQAAQAATKEMQESWVSGEILSGLPLELVTELAVDCLQLSTPGNSWLRWQRKHRRSLSGHSCDARAAAQAVQAAMRANYVLNLGKLEEHIYSAWKDFPDVAPLLTPYSPTTVAEMDFKNLLEQWLEPFTELWSQRKQDATVCVSSHNQTVLQVALLAYALHPLEQVPKPVQELLSSQFSEASLDTASNQIRERIYQSLAQATAVSVKEYESALPAVDTVSNQVEELRKLVSSMRQEELTNEA